jgi:glycosyltransferase involved in cell wall biosynthesis
MFCPLIAKFFLPHTSFVTQLETQFLSRRVSIFTQALLKATARCAGPKYLDYAYGTLLCQSDRIILLSEDHRRKFSHKFSEITSKTLVIPPAPIMRIVDDDDGASRKRVRDGLGIKPYEFLLAYFGYIYPDKGVETLFKAFRILTDRNSNTRLMMIGGSLGSSHNCFYLAGIHRLAKGLGIQDRIVWTGAYESDSDEPSRYLYAADACILPFDNGVTLNRSSVAAAAVHGLPIITTKGKHLEAPFRDKENVLLCPARDPKSLAAATGQVITNAVLRNHLRQGALRLAREFFNWNNAVTRTVEALSA